MKAPCFNCPERHQLCHSTCKQYLKYKNHRQGISEARDRFRFIDSYFSDAVKKSEKLRRQHA